MIMLARAQGDAMEGAMEEASGLLPVQDTTSASAIKAAEHIRKAMKDPGIAAGVRDDVRPHACFYDGTNGHTSGAQPRLSRRLKAEKDRYVRRFPEKDSASRFCDITEWYLGSSCWPRGDDYGDFVDYAIQKALTTVEYWYPEAAGGQPKRWERSELRRVAEELACAAATFAALYESCHDTSNRNAAGRDLFDAWSALEHASYVLRMADYDDQIAQLQLDLLKMQSESASRQTDLLEWQREATERQEGAAEAADKRNRYAFWITVAVAVCTVAQVALAFHSCATQATETLIYLVPL